MVVLPGEVVAAATRQSLCASLLPTDIGFFSRAERHLRRRARGVGQFIFIWCLGGEGWCELGGRTHTMSSGDFLIIPSHEAHAYGAATRNPWTIGWWHAVGTGLPDFLREFGLKRAGIVGVGIDPYALELFQRVLGILEGGYTSLRLIQSSQALAYLLSLLLGCARAQVQSTGAPRYMARIARSIAYARENLTRPLTVTELAAVAKFSLPYFHTLFRQQTGFAPMDYLIRLRLHRACQLLDGTDQTIRQIAGEVGYTDPLYFSRIFRSIHEISPSEYRVRRKG